MNTLIAFLVTLGVLIVVHEWGHYRVARACGVKVLRFSIGFGKTIWTRRIGETEWALSWLPLGGYVQFAGDREGSGTRFRVHRRRRQGDHGSTQRSRHNLHRRF